MLKQNWTTGDVFKFHVDEELDGYGQIVAIPPQDLKYFVIFDLTSSEELDLEMIVSSEILILAQSMDVKLNRGDWRVIGNAPAVVSQPELPKSKMHTPNGWMVVSYDGIFLWPATQDDLLKLKTKKTYSPAALEYALKAHLGLVEYKEFCDELIMKEKLTSS